MARLSFLLLACLVPGITGFPNVRKMVERFQTLMAGPPPVDGTGDVAAGWFDEDTDAVDVPKRNPVAVFDTSMGTMKLELFLDKAPVTASNFIDLVQKGFYDGIHFHRVIAGFMNQAGDPKSKDPTRSGLGSGGPPGDSTFKVLSGKYAGKIVKRTEAGKVPDEFGPEKLSNLPGTISMANTGRPHSGGSQFFLNVAHNRNLDWFDNSSPSKHPVFGKIIQGYEEVCKPISKVRTASRDAPFTPVKIKSITIEGI